MTETPTETTMPQGAAAGHTPGKWCIEGNHIVARDEQGAAVANDNNSIATVYGPDAAANARLIAAAPALLAACKELSGVWYDDDENAGLSDGLEEEVKLIRAAIAKAEARR